MAQKFFIASCLLLSICLRGETGYDTWLRYRELEGQALTQYLQNGTLPQAYMTQIDQAIKDAKTTAISNAAAQGLPTDPTQNTSLAATLSNIDNQRAGMITNIAQQLFNSGSSLIGTGTGLGTSSAGNLTGLGSGLTESSASGLLGLGQSAAGLSGQLYSQLVSNDTAAAANTGKAIATLAQALNTGATGKSGSSVTLPNGTTSIQVS